MRVRVAAIIIIALRFFNSSSLTPENKVNSHEIEHSNLASHFLDIEKLNIFVQIIQENDFSNEFQADENRENSLQ